MLNLTNDFQIDSSTNYAMNIIYVNSGIFHPSFLNRKTVLDVLNRLPGVKSKSVTSLNHLPTNLTQVNAIVLYYHHKHITDEALNRLAAFVHQGGGILAIHSVSASFKESEKYAEILGGRFTGHDKVGKFSIERTSDAFFGDIPPFEVRDELYIHKLQPGIQVHFSSRLSEEIVPVVWTQKYGQGKVCYLSLGHTIASMQHPQVQMILLCGLQWICGL